MASMYELIMDLPLFKGISRDHVSALLEHNRIVINTYEKGDVVVEAGNPCQTIGFIIAGTLSGKRTSADRMVSISYTLQRGAVIGADSMFGIDTSYQLTIRASERTSILYFTKEEYLRLITSDSIYLLNALNFLSRGLQYARIGAIDFNSASFVSLIARWIYSTTDKLCENVVLNFGFTLGEKELEECKPLQDKGIISIEDNRLRMLDVVAFMDYLRSR